MNKAGNSHTSATQEFSKSLNRISESAFGREEEDDIGVAFQKFAIVTRQLSELMKDLVSKQHNFLVILTTFFRGNLISKPTNYFSSFIDDKSGQYCYVPRRSFIKN